MNKQNILLLLFVNIYKNMKKRPPTNYFSKLLQTVKPDQNIKEWIENDLGIGYNLFLGHYNKGTIKREFVYKAMELLGTTYEETFPLDPKKAEIPERLLNISDANSKELIRNGNIVGTFRSTETIEETQEEVKSKLEANPLLQKWNEAKEQKNWQEKPKSEPPQAERPNEKVEEDQKEKKENIQDQIDTDLLDNLNFV